MFLNFMPTAERLFQICYQRCQSDSLRSKRFRGVGETDMRTPFHSRLVYVNHHLLEIDMFAHRAL